MPLDASLPQWSPPLRRTANAPPPPPALHRRSLAPQVGWTSDAPGSPLWLVDDAGSLWLLYPAQGGRTVPVASLHALAGGIAPDQPCAAVAGAIVDATPAPLARALVVGATSGRFRGVDAPVQLLWPAVVKGSKAACPALLLVAIAGTASGAPSANATWCAPTPDGSAHVGQMAVLPTPDGQAVRTVLATTAAGVVAYDVAG
jgi:hypothetical protein